MSVINFESAKKKVLNDREDKREKLIDRRVDVLKNLEDSERQLGIVTRQRALLEEAREDLPHVYGDGPSKVDATIEFDGFRDQLVDDLTREGMTEQAEIVQKSGLRNIRNILDSMITSWVDLEGILIERVQEERGVYEGMS